MRFTFTSINNFTHDNFRFSCLDLLQTYPSFHPFLLWNLAVPPHLMKVNIHNNWLSWAKNLTSSETIAPVLWLVLSMNTRVNTSPLTIIAIVAGSRACSTDSSWWWTALATYKLWKLFCKYLFKMCKSGPGPVLYPEQVLILLRSPILFGLRHNVLLLPISSRRFSIELWEISYCSKKPGLYMTKLTRMNL